MKQTKSQLMIAGSFCVAGILIFVAALVFKNPYDFIGGLGAGLACGGLVLCVYLFILLRNPVKAQRYENKLKDERVLFLTGKSAMLTLQFTVFAAAVTCCIASMLGDHSVTIYVVSLMYATLLFYGLAYWLLGKKRETNLE